MAAFNVESEKNCRLRSFAMTMLIPGIADRCSD